MLAAVEDEQHAAGAQVVDELGERAAGGAGVQAAARQLEGKWAMPMALDEVDTPRQLVTRIADPKLPFGGTWTWDLAPENGGTRVIVTERGVIRSPIFRVLSRFVFGYNGTMDAYLNALAKHFGESVQPGPPPGNA